MLRGTATALMALGGVFLGLVGPGMPVAPAAPTCTITFVGPPTGGPGDWGTAANWNPARVPLATDDVCIPAGRTVIHSSGTVPVLSIQSLGDLQLTGGTLTLTRTSDDSPITKLEMSGGTLAGAARVVIGSSMTWSGNALMTGVGTTAVAAGATLTQSGNVSLQNGRMLEIGGTLDNTVDATLGTGGTAPLIHVLAGGVLKKSGGSVSSRVDPQLQNDGGVQASSGTLQLDGGSSSGTGSFGATPATGTVALTGGTFTLTGGAKFLGSVSLSGATVQVAQLATLTLSGSNTMSGGTLGGTGTVSIPSGTLIWAGGTMDGAGPTALDAGATIKQTGGVTIQNSRLLQIGGTFDDTVDATLGTGGMTPHIDVLSTGVFKKSGGSVSSRVDPPLQNDGAVQASTGTLQLDGGSSAGAGSFGGAQGGTVAFTGSTFNLSDGAKFLGSVSLSGATVQVAAGGTLT
ncbi:MAG TPA: hypothetical protein VEG40_07720, partial [Gaiellaceae bacterium]|nr:hypothetical protein [Gaiellaceae bacterium]